MRSNISGAYFYIKEAKYEIKMRIAQHINGSARKVAHFGSWPSMAR